MGGVALVLSQKKKAIHKKVTDKITHKSFLLDRHVID